MFCVLALEGIWRRYAPARLPVIGRMIIPIAQRFELRQQVDDVTVIPEIQ